MDKYVEKYRVISEFDKNGELLKLPNGNIDLSNAFIYCKGGNITVSRYDENSLRVDVWQNIYTSVKDDILNSGVEIIRDIPMDGECSFIVEEDENIDKMLRSLNVKRNRKQSVGIRDKTNNYPYWKRHCNRVKGGK